MKLVEALIKAMDSGHAKPLIKAAQDCHIDYQTARNTLYQMRNRHDAMRAALDQYQNWRRRMKGNRRYL